ncbi:MAG: hydroxymethylglutaryl-CoA synthase [Nanoarchaeota archaeon]
MKCGIVGYGAYIPRLRIKVEEIARVWNKDGAHIADRLGVQEKAVAAKDEDAATISIEAARRAITQSGISPQDIGAIYVGSESHPYAVKPTASIVSEAINAGPHLTAADIEFACKAGTAGMQMCAGLVESDIIKVGMAIGADTAQGKPNDALEFTAASGGAAMVIGKHKVIATLDATYSITTDTTDFWRRQQAIFPSHTGRFTGEPSYFRHVLSAAQTMMDKAGLNPKDITHFVPHQPNGRFPVIAAKKLGFEMSHLNASLLCPLIGNTYSGSSMLGLAAVLDVAKAGERILVTSYGSGAGSDAFIFTVTDELEKRRASIPIRSMIQNKSYIDYAQYIIHRGKLKS